MSPNNQNPFHHGRHRPVVHHHKRPGRRHGYYFVRVAYLAGTNAGLVVSTSVLLTVQDRARSPASRWGFTADHGQQCSLQRHGLGIIAADLPVAAQRGQLDG